MVGCDLWHGVGFRNGGCRSSPSTPWLSFVNIFMIAMNIRPDHDAGADHNLEDHDIMIDKNEKDFTPPCRCCQCRLPRPTQRSRWCWWSRRQRCPPQSPWVIAIIFIFIIIFIISTEPLGGWPSWGKL